LLRGSSAGENDAIVSQFDQFTRIVVANFLQHRVFNYE
jgi:hypothetical protein